MSLLVKAGSFTASGLTGDQSITGVGFQPKVVLFLFNRLTSEGSGTDFALALGVGISASDRRTGGNYSLDASVSSGNAAFNQNTTCIYGTSGIGRADYISADVDGFTINWASVSSMIVSYLALGGPDLTDVKSGAITAKATTGTQGYTGVGFRPGAVIFWAGKFSTDGLDQSTNGAAMLGFATSSTKRGCVAWRNKNAANPQVAKRRQSRSKVLISLTDAGVFTEADYVSSDVDGFTLNYTTAGGSADVVYYLALAGPQFSVGAFNQPTATGSQSTSGAGFTPKAILTLSANDVTANNDTTNAHARVSVGLGTSATTRGHIWAGETDGVSPTVAKRNIDRTKLVKLMTEGSTPTVNAAADLLTFDSDGHTLDWTTADATTREVLVLWAGDSAAIPPDPTFQTRTNRPAMFRPGIAR